MPAILLEEHLIIPLFGSPNTIWLPAQLNLSSSRPQFLQMAGICHVVDVDWLSGTDPHRAGGFLGGSDTYFCPKETRVHGGNNHARSGNRRLRLGNNHFHDANNCVAYINNDVRPGH